MKKEYRNVTRSKQAIKRGLVSLFEQGLTLDSITIKRLAEEAQVTRGTFYNHYSSVSQVALEIEDDFLSRLTDLFLESDFTKGKRRLFFDRIQAYFEAAAADILTVAKCIPSQIYFDIKSKFNQTLSEIVLRMDPSLIHNEKTFSRIRLFAKGLVGSYFDCLLKESSESIEEVTNTGYETSEIMFPDPDNA